MTYWLRIGLIAVGFLQMVGFLTQQDWLRGLGTVTVASPLPIVFTEQKGIETFAHEFYLEFQNDSGTTQRIQITPALYARFDAPYNYRNVVGAAISYGPILPEPLRSSILRFVFQEPGHLTRALGLEPPLKAASIFLRTRTAGRADEWKLEVK